MLISTSYSPTEQLLNESQQLALALKCRWVPRRNQTVNQLRSRYGHQAVMLLTEDGLRLYVESERPLFFHPSMAALRVQALIRGEPDALIEAAGAQPGDSVLDCTAGLASDAIVFSYAVGENGQVTALESERMVFVLIREGLDSYHSEIPDLNKAMRRIRLLHENHLDYLRQLPDRSIDIVYFDPMFRAPIEDSASITPLRDVANYAPLSPEAVEHACRVAKKAVVLKEHRYSDQFRRLGFVRMQRANSKIAYGVIRV